MQQLSTIISGCFENMANEMLTLTEDIIRSRVNLQHDNLGIVWEHVNCF